MIVKKAKIFNQFFHSVFTIEDQSSLSELRQSLKMNPELISSIDFSVDEVHKELLSLQKDKACGPDCIPAHLLQVGTDFLAAPLSKLFKLSFSTGTLPRDWVTANVVPVYKKGDSHLSSNYRPISLISKLWKELYIAKLLKLLNLIILLVIIDMVFVIAVPPSACC